MAVCEEDFETSVIRHSKELLMWGLKACILASGVMLPLEISDIRRTCCKIQKNTFGNLIRRSSEKVAPVTQLNKLLVSL